MPAPSTLPSVHSHLRPWAAALALLGWAVLLLRLGRLAAEQPDLWSASKAVVLRFFQYFTLLTNCFTNLILTRYALGPGGRRGAWLLAPAAATSAAASMLLVALVYHVLLAHLWSPEGWDRVADVGLHYVMPSLILGFWWFALPTGCLEWRDLPRTWIFPLCYLASIGLQGALWGQYPYPFFNVSELGLPRVLAHVGGLFVGFNLGAGLLILGKWRRRSQVAPPSSIPRAS
jgi:hypothetical protein